MSWLGKAWGAGAGSWGKAFGQSGAWARRAATGAIGGAGV